MSKAKKKQKQMERAKRMSDSLLSGHSVITLPGEKRPSLPNRKNASETPEEQMAERQDLTEKTGKIWRFLLPGIITRFEELEDPRDVRKVKHTLSTVLVYALLLFMFKIGSRRATNKDLTRPIVVKNIQGILPELKSVPHCDTVNRVLKMMGEGVYKIQECGVSMLKQALKNKNFKAQMHKGKYLVLVDGSQKYTRDYKWAEQALMRHVGADKTEQYYVYVLEVLILLENGAVLPLWTEVLDNSDWKPGETKQDCEIKAFKRAAKQIEKVFSKGEVCLIADGLYATQPVLKICHKNKWDYIITVKEGGGMRDAWENMDGLLRQNMTNSIVVHKGKRTLLHRWENGLEYGSLRCPNKANILVCDEEWVEENPRSGGIPEIKNTRYVWVYNHEIMDDNVLDIAETGRKRQRIESTFHVEKHDGYEFSHCYSYDWYAAIGFHFLMKLAHLFNELIERSEIVSDVVVEKGPSGFIDALWDALSGAILNLEQLKNSVNKKFRWFMVERDIFKVVET